MANAQLVSYIKQQMQLGESEMPIKNSLRSVGWSDNDIEEAFKSVNPASTAGSAPAMGVSGGAAALSMPGMGGMAKTSQAEPRKMINLDTLSSSPAKASFLDAKPAVSSAVKSDAGGSWVGNLIWGILVVGFAGAAGYFYMTQSALQSKATDYMNQVQALTARINETQKNGNELDSRLAALNADKAMLAGELTLFAAPAGVPAGNVLPISLMGTVGGNDKSGFNLTTSEGVVVPVKNSKDALVSAALKPLVGKTAELSGMHPAGVREITVNAVNKTALAPTAAATSTQATTTRTTP